MALMCSAVDDCDRPSLLEAVSGSVRPSRRLHTFTNLIQQPAESSSGRRDEQPLPDRRGQPELPDGGRQHNAEVGQSRFPADDAGSLGDTCANPLLDDSDRPSLLAAITASVRPSRRLPTFTSLIQPPTKSSCRREQSLPDRRGLKKLRDERQGHSTDDASPGSPGDPCAPLQRSFGFASKYVTCERMGKGSSSTGIFYAVQRRDDTAKPTTRYACKEVRIAARGPQGAETLGSVANVMKELRILKTLRHPNLVELCDYFIESGTCRLVMPLLTGGQLRTKLTEQGSLAEEDARAVLTAVLRGVAHMHSKSIAHRDLKLENILFSDENSTYENVKIVDLGSAKKLCGETSTTGHTACDSPHLYIAPEMATPICEVGGKNLAIYGLAADLWSCGVILYILLSGHPPFDADSGVYRLLKQIRQGAYSLSDDPVWELVSDDAKDLVRRLLTTDPQKRPTAVEALAHPWLQDA